jgi:ribosomal protein S18 acetylase RimI-like enzyme
MPQSRANLPFIRRLEAVSFRAWPASTVSYDGSWQIRLTAAHTSKRINCVVPLDPSDYGNLDIRFSKAAKRFEDYGRELIIRQTSLMAPQIETYLRDAGWEVFEEVSVMSASLSMMDLPEDISHLPGHDIGRFIEARLAIAEEDPSLRAGYAEILSSIKPNFGLFVKEESEGIPLASIICVQDNDLAGLLSLAVANAQQRKGFGSEIVTSALRWARISGAKSAWLQVERDNFSAIKLYEKFGFQEAYSYCYWKRSEA